MLRQLDDGHVSLLRKTIKISHLTPALNAHIELVCSGFRHSLFAILTDALKVKIAVRVKFNQSVSTSQERRVNCKVNATIFFTCK
jgi:hypothetical protein